MSGGYQPSSIEVLEWIVSGLFFVFVIPGMCIAPLSMWWSGFLMIMGVAMLLLPIPFKIYIGLKHFFKS